MPRIRCTLTRLPFLARVRPSGREPTEVGRPMDGRWLVSRVARPLPSQRARRVTTSTSTMDLAPCRSPRGHEPDGHWHSTAVVGPPNVAWSRSPMLTKQRWAGLARRRTESGAAMTQYQGGRLVVGPPLGHAGQESMLMSLRGHSRRGVKCRWPGPRRHGTMIGAVVIPELEHSAHCDALRIERWEGRGSTPPPCPQPQVPTVRALPRTRRGSSPLPVFLSAELAGLYSQTRPVS
jgi:hypothetical protein